MYQGSCLCCDLSTKYINIPGQLCGRSTFPFLMTLIYIWVDNATLSIKPLTLFIRSNQTKKIITINSHQNQETKISTTEFEHLKRAFLKLIIIWGKNVIKSYLMNEFIKLICQISLNYYFFLQVHSILDILIIVKQSLSVRCGFF